MHGGVAQLGEHLPCTQRVRSSSLLISTSAGDGFAQGRELPGAEEAAKAQKASKRDEAESNRKHGLIAQVVRAHA